MDQRAVCLLSGGLDSATCLAIAASDGFEVHALTVDYGQRHVVEIEQARSIARVLKAASHRVVSMDLRAVGGSALTAEIEVPKDRSEDGSIPDTYVPARNTVFLGLALGLAEVLGARDIYLGVNAVDYSGYPDCRPQFIEAFEKLAQVDQMFIEYHQHLECEESRDELSRVLALLEAAGFGYQIGGSLPPPFRGRTFQGLGIYAYNKLYN